jgi:hypothetical protein
MNIHDETRNPMSAIIGEGETAAVGECQVDVGTFELDGAIGMVVTTVVVRLGSIIDAERVKVKAELKGGAICLDLVEVEPEKPLRIELASPNVEVELDRQRRESAENNKRPELGSEYRHESPLKPVGSVVVDDALGDL